MWHLTLAFNPYSLDFQEALSYCSRTGTSGIEHTQPFNIWPPIQKVMWTRPGLSSKLLNWIYNKTFPSSCSWEAKERTRGRTRTCHLYQIKGNVDFKSGNKSDCYFKILPNININIKSEITSHTSDVIYTHKIHIHKTHTGKFNRVLTFGKYFYYIQVLFNFK